MANDDRIDSEIGRVLRAARRQAGMTMAQLAELATISQPHLSQMENGKASPSIATLYALAGALGVGPQDLLPPAPQTTLVVVRAGDVDPVPLIDSERPARTRVLVGAPGRSLQVHEVEADDGDDLGGWFEHEGEEFLRVEVGTISLEVAGSETARLEAGDSAWYPSTAPHRWSAVDGDPVRILLVVGSSSRTLGAGAAHPTHPAAAPSPTGVTE